MKNRIITYLTLLMAIMVQMSCSDNDDFSVSYQNVLTFETDTLSLDTCFSTVPTPHKKFKVYNNSGNGIRISSIILAQRNQTGFRVNVNGTYLSDANGYSMRDVELYDKDSLRVFVELTSQVNGNDVPTLLEDNLIFTLENGRNQVVNLNAWSWDADILNNETIGGDTVTYLGNENGKPILIYGMLTVDSLATLTVMPGTTLYFHDNAGIDVKGKLKIMGEQDNEVTMRCDRFDWMVSNLSYDNNPGQWGGIHYHAVSYDNEINYTDIHGGSAAIVCDSADDDTKQKLNIRNSSIHNMRSYGIYAEDCNISIENTQISNTLANCLTFCGGKVDINQCTIAQYYPFDANRGAALFFSNGKDGISHPLDMKIYNSLIKGYADDVVIWSHGGTEDSLRVLFDHCLVRTVPGIDYEYMFKDCLIEDDVDDTLTLARNSFVLFDTQNFFYDFTPKEGTAAIDAANPETALPIDRKGRKRDKTLPDIGCYETENVDKDIKDE